MSYIKEKEQSDFEGEGADKKGNENLEMLRKSIREHIKFDVIKKQNVGNSVHTFRQGTEILRTGGDFVLIKNSQTDYEYRYHSYSKILTGFSLPYYGEVELPTRKVKAGFEVGLTQSEALYFYS